MSRTYRRKNELWLKHWTFVGYLDFSFHSGTIYYDAWLREENNVLPYLTYLSVKHRCTLKKVERKTSARFHGDAGKSRHYLRAHFIREFERKYRRRANHLAAQSLRVREVEDYDFLVSQKLRKIHYQLYS